MESWESPPKQLELREDRINGGQVLDDSILTEGL